MVEGLDEYWVPECVRAYLRGAGFSTRALEDMEPHIREWDPWMRAVGEFYDYRDTDGFGRVYQVHRRTIMPAIRVCREWGSLLLDEKTVVACESQERTDWLGSLFSSTDFWGRAQETVVRAFGLGTGALAVWMDVGRRLLRVRHYDARMAVPLSWDAEGVRERAFVTRCFSRGTLLDQLQMHVVDDSGAYRIRTACFDGDGREVSVPGVAGRSARDALLPPSASCGRRCRTRAGTSRPTGRACSPTPSTRCSRWTSPTTRSSTRSMPERCAYSSAT
ncbi:MAG: hypothetical protein MR415_01995 [Coriobacteriaceae bacterium]|nr:hypothetical protein [Coriobacteriaceae bacterium]MCI7439013.1 hypothetical protein [Coriobacteriaceae bacterium]